MCVLVKMVTLRPALYFVKSLPTFKALTFIADIMQSSALRMQSDALSVMHRMFFLKSLLSLFSVIICVDCFIA